MIERLKSGDRQEPPAERGAFLELIELSPCHQACLLDHVIDVIPTWQQATEKNADLRFVLDQQTHEFLSVVAFGGARKVVSWPVHMNSCLATPDLDNSGQKNCFRRTVQATRRATVGASPGAGQN